MDKSLKVSASRGVGVSTPVSPEGPTSSLPEGFDQKSFDDILGKRGITPEVARGAFLRFEQGDIASVLAFDPTIEVRGEGAVALVQSRVNRTSGVYMRRWAVPGADPFITGELRPDRFIWSGELPTVNPHESMTPWERLKHVRRTSTTAKMVKDGMLRSEYENWQKWWMAKFRGDLENFGADHFGREPDPDLPHVHFSVVKYLFSANPTKQIVEPGTPHAHSDFEDPVRAAAHWGHRHLASKGYKTRKGAERKAAEEREQHPEGAHWVHVVPREDIDSPRWREMYAESWRRPPRLDPFTVIYPDADRAEFGEPGIEDGTEHAHFVEVKDTSAALAKRLSIHPMSRDRLAGAQRVFFLLEGCLKEAAVVSAGEVTFSCPSVTLWQAPEFNDFAREYLRGKQVYVVCDSDWDRKSDRGVLRQTLLARDRLRLLGIEAEACAPPPGDRSRGCRHEEGKDHKPKHGVDDHLACPGGGRMDDLLTIIREEPYGIADWIHDRTERPRADGTARNVTVLRFLSVHSTAGEITTSGESIARAVQHELGSTSLEGTKKAVYRAIDALVAMGAVEETQPRRENVRQHLRKDYRDWSYTLRITDRRLLPRQAVVPLSNAL